MIGLLVALTTLIFLPRINAAEFPRESMTGMPQPFAGSGASASRKEPAG